MAHHTGSDLTFDLAPLEALAQDLVAAAKRAGADAADAVIVRARSRSVEVRRGAIEEADFAENDELGLRAFVGLRSAVVSTNDPSPEGFARLAEQVVAMAKAAPQDRFAGLLDPPFLSDRVPDLDLVDRRILSVEELEAQAMAAEAAAFAVPGVTNSGGALASAGVGGFVLATSTGFCRSSVSTRHTLYVTAVAGEGTGMERDYDYSTSTHAEDLESPDEVGRIAGERAVRRLNPRKVSSRRVPVIFDWRAAGSLLGHLAGAINGAAVARGTSFLKDKRGAQLFAKGIRIIDDPLRPRGLRSQAFDGEGARVQRLAVVEDGVLGHFFLDGASARELGLASTGHAARGPSSAPAPAPTNLHLEPGSRSRSDLIGSISDGFLVTDLIGMGVNPVTGDYSRGASGFWIENGTVVYPVSEVTIAGNLVDMFAALTPADDLVFRSAVNAPSVLVEGLTVAGQ